MSERKRKAKMRTWARYRDRCDRLTVHQDMTAGCLAPMRCTPGYFRAVGWNTDGGRWNSLRHGA
jgi:hypothetical protein